VTDTAVFSILESVWDVRGGEWLTLVWDVVLAEGNERRGLKDIPGLLLDMALLTVLPRRMGRDRSPSSTARGDRIALGMTGEAALSAELLDSVRDDRRSPLVGPQLVALLREACPRRCVLVPGNGLFLLSTASEGSGREQEQDAGSVEKT
jgi:hypothetical protein